MPKARLLRPEFWTDEKVVGMSPFARLLFAGMWNFACDNGHLDDSVLQLKMKILPADPVDVGDLLDEVIASGTVVRKDGYLKVLNLSKQQSLDLRFLVFCDHCDRDPERRYSREDKKATRRSPSGDTSAARVPHEGGTQSARRSGDVDGDGDGGVDSATAPRKRAAARGTRIDLDFEATDDMRSWAQKNTPTVDIDSATEDFIDYWTGVAGSKGVKLDWVATWRNNMRTCQTRGLHPKRVEASRPVRYRDFGSEASA